MSDESDEHIALREALLESLADKITPLLNVTLALSGSCTSGAKVEVTIASPSFNDVKTLQRHKMVNAVFAPFLSSGQVRKWYGRQFGLRQGPPTELAFPSRTLYLPN